MKLLMSISKLRLHWCAALLVAVAGSTVFGESLLETMDQEVSSLYEKSKDAVVRIHALRQFQIGNLLLLPSYHIATGFFVDKDGVVRFVDTNLTPALIAQRLAALW